MPTENKSHTRHQVREATQKNINSYDWFNGDLEHVNYFNAKVRKSMRYIISDLEGFTLKIKSQKHTILKKEIELNQIWRKLCILCAVYNMYGWKENLENLEQAIIKTIDGKNGITPDQLKSLETFLKRYAFFANFSEELRSDANPDTTRLFAIEALDRQFNCNLKPAESNPELLREAKSYLSQTTPIYTQLADINNQIKDIQEELVRLKMPFKHYFTKNTLEVYRYIYSILRTLSKNPNNIMRFESPFVPECIVFDESDTYISLLKKSLSYMIENCDRVKTIAVCSQIFIDLYSKEENNVTPFSIGKSVAA